MAMQISVKIGFDNGLVLSGSKPFAWTSVDLSSVGFCGKCQRTILEELIKNSIYNTN